jgi:hypothetical protein
VLRDQVANSAAPYALHEHWDLIGEAYWRGLPMVFDRKHGQQVERLRRIAGVLDQELKLCGDLRKVLDEIAKVGNVERWSQFPRDYIRTVASHYREWHH